MPRFYPDYENPITATFFIEENQHRSDGQAHNPECHAIAEMPFQFQSGKHIDDFNRIENAQLQTLELVYLKRDVKHMDGCFHFREKLYSRPCVFN